MHLKVVCNPLQNKRRRSSLVYCDAHSLNIRRLLFPTSDTMEMESTEVVLSVLMLYSFVTEFMQPEQLAYNHKPITSGGGERFWQTEGRWRCLMKRNHCKMDKITIQVAACCILHNLCESDEYRDEWTALPETQLYEVSEQLS